MKLINTQCFINFFAEDKLAPVVTHVDDITKIIGSNVNETTVTWTEPTATDNSGSVFLRFQTYAPGSAFPIGITKVTYIFSDSSENNASTSFNVIVIRRKFTKDTKKLYSKHTTGHLFTKLTSRLWL